MRSKGAGAMGPGWLVTVQALLATVVMTAHGVTLAGNVAQVETASGVAAGTVLPLVLPVGSDVSNDEPLVTTGPIHDAVPVLMYHVIAPGPNSLYVPPAELQAQLSLLASHGFETISLAQLAAHFAHGVSLPDRPVVLTFDDGYISAYTAALPLLQQYGMTATFFIITDLVGQAGYVSWEQVAELAAAGMEIGAHTITHPDLRNLTGVGLTREVAGPQQMMTDKLGHRIDFFAYPAGAYNTETVAVVSEHYVGAVTTHPGAATPCQDPALWHRIRVNQGTPAAALLDTIKYWTNQPPCR